MLEPLIYCILAGLARLKFASVLDAAVRTNTLDASRNDIHWLIALEQRLRYLIIGQRFLVALRHWIAALDAVLAGDAPDESEEVSISGHIFFLSPILAT